MLSGAADGRDVKSSKRPRPRGQKTWPRPRDSWPRPWPRWGSGSGQYSVLYPLFERVLCVPASSAPVERVFSQSGLLMRPNRAHMTDKLLDELVFAKCNDLYSITKKFVTFGLFIVVGLGLTLDGLGLAFCGLGLGSSWPR